MIDDLQVLECQNDQMTLKFQNVKMIDNLEVLECQNDDAPHLDLACPTFWLKYDLDLILKNMTFKFWPWLDLEKCDFQIMTLTKKLTWPWIWPCQKSWLWLDIDLTLNLTLKYNVWFWPCPTFGVGIIWGESPTINLLHQQIPATCFTDNHQQPPNQAVLFQRVWGPGTYNYI